MQMKLSHVLWMCLFAIIVIRTLVRRWKYRRIYSFMASVPGPLAFPLVGSVYLLLGVNTRNVCSRLKAAMNNFPKTFAYWDSENPVIVTGELEVFNAVLASSVNIDKIQSYDLLKKIIPSIVSSSGDRWHTTRKLVNPAYRSSVVKSFDDNFVHYGKIFIDRLKEHANGDLCDIFPLVHLCFIDFICANMSRTHVDFQKHKFYLVSHSMTKTAEMIFERMFSPLLWPDFLYKLSGKQRLFQKYYSEGLLFVRMIIQLRMKSRKKMNIASLTPEKLQVIIDILLDNFDMGLLTEDRVFAECSEVATAGSLSVAITSSWIFKMVAMFPKIQDRAFKEILENCNREMVMPDDLSQLHYVEMIIKESLRLFSVPATGRKITEDLRVNDKFKIPAGVDVWLSIYALHHDAELWERPGEFYPEHFTPAKEKSRPKGAFIPFLSGPRICPGNLYAMRSIKFLVANTLLRYKFSTDEKPPDDMRDMDYKLVFLMWPMSGFNLRIEQR